MRCQGTCATPKKGGAGVYKRRCRTCDSPRQVWKAEGSKVTHWYTGTADGLCAARDNWLTSRKTVRVQARRRSPSYPTRSLCTRIRRSRLSVKRTWAMRRRSARDNKHPRMNERTAGLAVLSLIRVFGRRKKTPLRDKRPWNRSEEG